MVMPEFDPYERRILSAVQTDCSVSVQELSRKTCLSPSQTWRRLKELQDRKVIDRTVAILDPSLAGLPICVYAYVSLVKHENTMTSKFEESVCRRPEVLECHSMLGDADYVLKIRVQSIAAFDKFMREVIHGNSSVLTVKSSITLRTVKYTTALQIP